MEVLVGILMLSALLSLMEMERGIKRRRRERAQGVKGRTKHSQYYGARNRSGLYQSSWGVSGRKDKDEPGLVYLIEDKARSALKVGITSLTARSQRLEHHKKEGWAVVGTWTTASLVVARDVEKAVLRWWRDDLGLRPAFTTGVMDGASETVLMTQIETSACVSRIESLLDEAGQLEVKRLELDQLETGMLVVTRGKIVRVEKVPVATGYKRGRARHETWWKVTLHNRGAYLTLEFAPRKETSIRAVPLKTLVEVTGRVEGIGGHRRMTNPEWILVD